ncbi:hypothetical protein M8C21_028989 [Ambrosia artemisiifolia]|uniref:Uncharacterized protein n=1 Tax=Ambrosia artemisiifolia TaxID=4212 RepID=A0AAD5BLJ9_AMBAR|nr:hypothetical protein M8C21_028989 [Ambrosia artemisiifolia]
MGSPSDRRETHGSVEDIDVDTPISEVKGPNIFHRAKEEIEAIVDTIQSKREPASPRKQSSLADNNGSPSHCRDNGKGEDIDADTPISEFKGPNIFYRAKEEIEAIVDSIQSKRESASPKKQSSLTDRGGSPSHRRETHGREDIDPDTPISEFKAPNIFHRAKEEIEAIVDTIHSKRESDRDAESPKKDGFRASIRQVKPSLQDRTNHQEQAKD